MASQPYIATEKIYFGTALGYNPGDVVADEVVQEHDLQDNVARADSKSAKEATKSAEGPSQP